MSRALDIINWYEEQFGRKLIEAEKPSTRVQVALNKFNISEAKGLESFGIKLGGLEYGKQ